MQVRQLADQIGFGKVFWIHTRHVDLLGDPCEAGWPGTVLMLRLVPPDWGRNAGSNTAARSLQLSRGWGVRRCSTASWWRRTRISISLAVSERTHSIIQLSSFANIW